MAVYTQVSTTELAAFLAGYDVGELRAVAGIAAGVENSNYRVETTRGQFILTLYEGRVDRADLPFFIDLLDHLAARGCRVPRFIPDRQGRRLQQLAGRPACLVEFLSGDTVTEPDVARSRAAGRALGQLHAAGADFEGCRRNSMAVPAWHALAGQCRAHADAIAPDFADRISAELAFLSAHWPEQLSQAVIHADLFPDNVLMQGVEVTGLIDFYFSCTDVRIYDLAITHAAWCFDDDGSRYHADRAAALVEGYRQMFELSAEERAAFATLCRGAALRFTLTRAYDWVNTPSGALVTAKYPLAFLRRLDFYASATPVELLGS
ncbi:homoserine kinase [Sphingomonas sp. MG17]|uniref:Homoserine kinase n=1 Tax=Sphingomonas tagetis TaxID=2949092 RepID=A0A9X2KM46_9SPHN|nr:homoserine kinase [Sphingomonas tagetis]MCP3731500.1 homoserine kinase [Sphingomonas tagetis]